MWLEKGGLHGHLERASGTSRFLEQDFENAVCRGSTFASLLILRVEGTIQA